VQPDSSDTSKPIKEAQSDEEAERVFHGVTYPPRDFAQPICLPAKRLAYCVKKLRHSAVEMTNDVQNFFIKPMPHREQLPQSLETAYIACTLYSSTTENNAHIVRGIVMDTYLNLVCDKDDVDLEAELAKIQATLLLHILLLSDGDIQYRSLADRNVDHLRDIILRLQRRDATEMLDHIKASTYARWLFLENIRRTILTSTFVECIYMNLRDGICMTVPFLSMLPITVEAALWAAKSERDWKKATHIDPPNVLPYGEALARWEKDATQGNLDTLQHLLYVACKGFSGVPT